MVNERRIEENLEKIASALEYALDGGNEDENEMDCLCCAVEQLAGCVRLLLDAMKQREAAEKPMKGKTKTISTMMY